MITIILATTLAITQDGSKAPPPVKPAIITPSAAPKQETEAQMPLLAPGSAAPFPNIAHFVKGESVDGYQPGKTYIFEFWATWCGPCKAGMPHLSEVQKHYADKGVTVIGISDEDLEKVQTFLAKPEWAEKTQYTLATDPDRSAWNQYMAPALQSGIPTAFIVKDEVVQWIGHPMTMDEPLKAVVDGNWDLNKAKIEFEGTAAAKKVQRRLGSLMREAKTTGDYTAFLEMLDAEIAKAPKREAAAMELQKFQILLVGAKQPEAAYKLGDRLVAHFAAEKQQSALNQIAWFVLDTKDVPSRDFDFALRAAIAANEASGGKDGAILDTLARAYWEKGDKATAVSTQESAVAKTEPGPMLDEMKATLEKYKTTNPGGTTPG